MLTRYGVWLDGIGLQDISESIYITDIREQAPKRRAVTLGRQDGKGTRLLRVDRQSINVSVRFAIREYDTRVRRDVCSQVRSWAHDGYLTTSDRPGQRLFVSCDRLPTVDSALKWTNELEVSFVAYECPWWEAETLSTARVKSKSANIALMNAGDTESPSDATITASAAVKRISLSVNGQTMQLSGLSLTPGSTLTISHDRMGLLSIKKGSVSLLGKRTADSSDDLIVSPGANSVTFSADGVCNVLLSTRGRFL